MKLKIALAGQTEQGGRLNNEDAFTAVESHDRALLLVADGIGGYAAGEVAASMAIDAIKKADPHDGSSLAEAIEEANQAIAEFNDETEQDAGATIVASLINDGKAIVAWAGDSRLYLIRAGQAAFVTTDHAEGRCVTKSLGLPEPAEPQLVTLDCLPKDRVLLCTDGLSGVLPDAEISRIMTEAASPEAACSSLIAAALGNGSRDNITTLVALVEG